MNNFPIAHVHLDAVRNEIEKMEKDGIISRAATDYISPDCDS